ncbi:hypothetical protein HanIR_Chr06g0290781 [Helianthus annuus]|nr:hypothetical protein HanIR_Chr06g0290781 [Helianthus annuus]
MNVRMIIHRRDTSIPTTTPVAIELVLFVLCLSPARRLPDPHGSNGSPQRPGLFSYFDAGKVVSWPPEGIGPVSLLFDTSKSFRNERLTNDPGIKPVSELCERSRSKAVFKLPTLNGISPVRLLYPRFKTCR